MVTGKVCPHEHVPEPLLDVWPEKVLFHGLARVVDLVEDIDDARAQQRRSDVKVVHEAVQEGAKVNHLLRAELGQVFRVLEAWKTSQYDNITRKGLSIMGGFSPLNFQSYLGASSCIFRKCVQSRDH